MRAFAFDKMLEYFVKIIPYLSVTLTYVVLSYLFGLLFAVILALFKIGHNRVLKAVAHGYTTIMRCTPAIVMLFLVYYGVPQVVSAITGRAPQPGDRLMYVIITLSMFCAATLSEVFRSAYESLDRTQIDATKAIGMTNFQAYVHILGPQMIRIAAPNLCNTVLSLFKEGALAYTIGLFDLLGCGYYILGINQGAYAIEVYLALVVIYWPIAAIITRLSHHLERRLSYE